MLFEQLDLEQIQDVAQAKRAIVGLLNLVEDLQATVRGCKVRCSVCATRSTT